MNRAPTRTLWQASVRMIGSPEGVDTDRMLADFAFRAEPVGTVVQRVPDSAAAASLLAELAREHDTTSIAISGEIRLAAPSLLASLKSLGITSWAPTDANEARDAPLGVSLARRAVAETGSVLLAEENLADRAVGLVSIAHVTVCRTADLVPALVEATAVMREIATRPHGGYSTLVTGPSRTADIEMSLTIGVQGPATVYALFIDDLT